MAYRDSFAAAILVDGKVQKETSDNTVTIPYGTEYTIRLKNKSRKRSVSDIYIDGRIVVKGMIVPANDTVDLERFVNDNLNEGNRFKIVRKDDSRVEQPDDSEVGNLEIRFYLEKDKPEVKVVEHHSCAHRAFDHCARCCYDHYCGICNPHRHWPSPRDIPYKNTWYGIDLSEKIGEPHFDTVSPKGMRGSTLSSQSVAMNNVQCSTTLDMANSEAAATVEGSKSFQRFVTASIDVDYDKPVTLMLKLRGVSKIIDTCKCGYKRKQADRYCPTCGNELAVGIAA